MSTTLASLEVILSSNQKSSLLAFLMLAPDRYFSVLELSRRIGLSGPSVATLLAQFSRDGLVKSSGRARARVYAFNPKHHLAGQMQTWLKKHGGKYEDELFTAIAKVGEVKAVFLSGIFTGQPQLPVDILVVGKVNLNKLDTFLQQCGQMMGTEINYSIMSEGEFKIRRDTFDRFIKDIFDYPHITVMDKMSKKAE
jgi:hypothetical protein